MHATRLAVVLAVAAGCGGPALAQSVCSYPAAHLIAEVKPTCEGIINPAGTVEYGKTYNMHGHLLCPNGAQDRYDHYPLTVRANGACGIREIITNVNQYEPACPPTFHPADQNGRDGGYHVWTQRVTHKGWAPFFCYSSGGQEFSYRVRMRYCSDTFCAPRICYDPGTCMPPYDTWNYETCRCEKSYSPVVVDIEGDGYHLASWEAGVLFDVDGDGTREAISWTSRNRDDAWLVLDRNGNGTIDSAAEMFGNWTPVGDAPRGETAENGFEALAALDTASERQTAPDGRIDVHDPAYERLRVWVDGNHDGVSQPGELRSLADVSLVAIETQYAESRRRDFAGNEFRQRARSWWRDSQGTTTPRFVYDVWLVTQASAASPRR